jgi:glucose/arabinose dehydrogenase
MTWRNVFVVSLAIGLLSAATQPVTAQSEQPPQGAIAFVADNAATAANAPDLVQHSLGMAPGFNLQPRSLWLPPGFSVSVIAAGLQAPRFMALDDAGNLLVADAGAGAIYRYPAADVVISPSPTPPAPLLSGLDAPSNVAFWDGYLYIGETGPSAGISTMRHPVA